MWGRKQIVKKRTKQMISKSYVKKTVKIGKFYEIQKSWKIPLMWNCTAIERKKGPHNFWTKCPEFGHSAYDVLTYVHLNILWFPKKWAPSQFPVYTIALFFTKHETSILFSNFFL